MLSRTSWRITVRGTWLRGWTRSLWQEFSGGVGVTDAGAVAVAATCRHTTQLAVHCRNRSWQSRFAIRRWTRTEGAPPKREKKLRSSGLPQWHPVVHGWRSSRRTRTRHSSLRRKDFIRWCDQLRLRWEQDSLLRGECPLPSSADNQKKGAGICGRRRPRTTVRREESEEIPQTKQRYPSHSFSVFIFFTTQSPQASLEPEICSTGGNCQAYGEEKSVSKAIF